MPSLTRDEAVERADLLRVDEYRHRSGPDPGRATGRFGSTTTIRFACGRARRGHLRRARSRPSCTRPRLNGVPLDPAGAGRQPAAAGRIWPPSNELVVRATMAYSQHRRGAAPVRRPGGRRDLPLRAGVPRRRPADLRLLRPARPQGAGDAARCPRRPAGRWPATAPAREVAPGRWEFAPTAAAVHLPGQPDRRAVPRAARRATTASRSAALLPARPGRRTWTRTPTRSSTSPGPASTGTTSCSGCGTRSASTTRRSCPSSTPARWRTRAWSRSATSSSSAPP